jgi:hypothetical protein
VLNAYLINKNMTSETRYQAARIVSNAIANHFAHKMEAAGKYDGRNSAPMPDAQIIETILDVAFWASLRREEGNSPKISLAFLSPQHAGHAILFKERINLIPDALIKLSPGVERPGVHLGVWFEGEDLYVWGTTTTIPDLCFVLDLSEPGLLVIKHRRRNGLGKFANVAVLSGDQIKIVNEKSAGMPHCPDILKLLLGYASDVKINPLVQLAVSMRAHKHGGTLLIVPQETEDWKRSIIHPMKYAVLPSYSGISDLIFKEGNDKFEPAWQTLLKTEIDRLAGLTAVDGATIISDKYELIAFGSKIIRPEGNALVEQVMMNEPIEGNEPIFVNPAISGGTRHLSAAQFVHDQRKALAFVASQDGHFTVFSWLHGKEMVQAHRIETLLL